MDFERYPLALVNWSGGKKGGYRQPFQNASGRPLDEQIITPLVEKLSNWVESLLSGKPNIPFAVLLVGGPGNGKTDAVEGAVEYFDLQLGAEGQLVAKFATQYIGFEDRLPPRRAVASFKEFIGQECEFSPEIRLVQDATEKETSLPSESAESLLLEELSEIYRGEYKGIYLGCVNRGILANTSALAIRRGETELAHFLNDIVAAASGGVEALECWPLKDTRLALWPMDVESLVAPLDGNVKNTVFHQILKKVLADENWNPPCDNKSDCPFCQNKMLLDKERAQDNIVRFLYHYELASGKRWTFRDLYSLVSYLFIGETSSLVVDGKPYSPCDWTAKILQFEKKGPNTLAGARARYLLMNRLYHHRLFTNWPRLTTGEHYKAQRSIFSSSKPKESFGEDDFNLAKFHFSALKSLAEKEHTAISELLSGDFSNYMDPALANGDAVLFEQKTTGKEVCVDLLEEHFSLSVNEGLELVSSRITLIERKLLIQLARADEALSEQHHPIKYSNQARMLQGSIRQFSARVAKRSLGLRYGISKDAKLFTNFAKVHLNNDHYDSIEDLVEQLVNEDTRFFKIPLSTTFGQPVARRDRDVSLRVRNVKTSMKMFRGNDSRPAHRSPYIKIHKRYVPVTFALYKALIEIEEGLDTASLPQEVFALIDEVKSITAGQVARDKDFVDGNIDLTIGKETYPLKVGSKIRFRGKN
ncbi:hypothetical protein AYY26_06695 [Photobacterium phosphoreum]|uniref:hypothetical protein n=1 Tax=Photobacterium phosphoreum TaxID=659 RepID=UPI0007F961E1|nr:hypothetical protein [Photobacterium phosphoreum]OBU41301.1 hypothetical protein AYY26_06695 [Photobacterium phosphoreum]